MQNVQTSKCVAHFQIDLSEKVGKGTFGEVCLGRDTKTQEVVAVKIINIKANDKNFDQMKKLCENECQIMQRFQHPNLVKFYSFQRTLNNVYFMMEYCEGGSLDQYIARKCPHKNQLKYLAETEARIILSQIVDGYKEMYKQNIVHRDLKPSNILINKGIAKISDFGFSKILQDFDNQILQTFAGTPLYMSPQILNPQAQRQYSTKTDIWSLGIIFFEVLYGTTPWRASSFSELILKISSVPLRFPAIPRVSEQMKQIIFKMLQVEEKDRMSWEELFQLQIQEDQESMTIINRSIIQINQEQDLLKKKNLEKNLNRGMIQNIQHGRQQQEKLEKAYQQINKDSNKTKSTESFQSRNQNSISPARKEKIFSQKQSTSPIRTLVNLNQNQNQNVLGKEQQEQIVNNYIIKKIAEWITHKKNKSEFLNRLSQSLFEQWSACINIVILYRKIPIKLEYLFRNLLFVDKILISYFIQDFYKIIKEEFKQVNYTQMLLVLLKDLQKKNGPYFAKENCELIREFLIELVKRTKIALQDTAIQEMKLINSIATMELTDKKQFDTIFLIGLEYYYKIVLAQLPKEQNDRGYLEFAVRLKDCCKIHEIVKFQEVDFFKYEDNITNSSNQQLLEQLQR
ncbi:unnamed protein product (macronuclear) [Paramecium tetraurelia]|uniref:Protein kinase domain-containing protein n=1 Tax=Paramecium tetraurelia TaxID=5888 RepID=A0CS98_PARTE|nr:uncharacterized protein GSPATT00009937001 [Paramecium tetraurelia]CAK73665.1 unnamed protein product [Paramecium tetraurelia]|eukprot:XP_001441062.1 hypothetical protein (macronuclear) [Paramecium tetraurelia strain d4-2]